MQMRKYKIGFAKIDRVFISHLHGDHIFGLMGLISTLGLLGRKQALYVHAHTDLERLYRPHLDYFCAELPFEVVFVPLNPKERQIIYEDKRVVVESIPLRHRISTCGFVFTEKPAQPNMMLGSLKQQIGEAAKQIKSPGQLRKQLTAKELAAELKTKGAQITGREDFVIYATNLIISQLDSKLSHVDSRVQRLEGDQIGRAR